MWVTQFFSKQRSRQYYCMEAAHARWLSARRKSLKKQECYMLYWTNPGGNIPQNSCCTATYNLSRNPSKLNEQDMWDSAGEVRTNSYAIYSCETLCKNEQGRLARTYLWQLCTDTGCSTEDLPESMDDGEAREGQGNPCWRHDMMMVIYRGT